MKRFGITWLAQMGLALAWLALVSQGANAQTVTEYGKECAQKVSDVRAFSCLEGEVVPITVNGKPPAQYTPGMRCDKPSLLVPLTAGSDGHCVPHSRALVLRDDSQAQISAFCRQKKIRPSDTYLFDEIDIVAHNVRTGSTCWFQATAPMPLAASAGLDGRSVPSPTKVSFLPPQPAPAKFWNLPSKTAQEKCVKCHDSGPFMYSPFIAQTKALPGNPFGKYKNDVGHAFKDWPQPYGITTRGNTCTTCHRMGTMNSCQVALFQSSGMASYAGQDDWAKQFPQSHWMAPGNLHSKVQWDQQFTDSLRMLAACCQDPKGAACLTVDYNAFNRTTPLATSHKHK